MKIHSFDDIKAIDENLASLFLRKEEAVNWIYAMENGIKEWIGKHNKQHWEIVRYVTEQRGILGKYNKDRITIKLSREDFARVLLKFCPNAVKKGETVSALKTSIEHYKFARLLKMLDKLPDGHIVRPLIKDVEDLLDNKPIIEKTLEKSEPTLEELLEEYLRREVEEKPASLPLSKVCIRPQYGECCPAISIENYMSEQFFNEHRPSYIIAFEIIDGVLQKDKLHQLNSQYQEQKKIVKLFIVSSSGLFPEVRALASKLNIGYVLLNPNRKMTSDSYILERTIEDYAKSQHDLAVLAATKPMDSPILIMDGAQLTSSLADILSNNRVAVKSSRLLSIPYISNDIIEEKANALTQEDVKFKIQILNNLRTLNVDLSIDPFGYADSCNLGYSTENMKEDYQLGVLDIKKNHVTLNSMGLNNYNRYRFTMAHELGHYILHSQLFKEKGVVSVGESKNTIISKKDSSKLELQANMFASSLLMPKKLVNSLYSFFFEFYIHQRYGDKYHSLYYNPKQPETWDSYNCIVKKMASLLGVSLQAMEIRLKTLGLLIMPNQSSSVYNKLFRNIN